MAAVLTIGTVGSSSAAHALGEGNRAFSDGACTSRTDGVTVVVDFSELGGSIVVRCVDGKPASGLSVLQAAGFSYTFVPHVLGMVCTIDNNPTACNGAPASAYWSYWHASRGGTWEYSKEGAGTTEPVAGGVEGWAFGAGEAPGIAAPAPPSTSTSTTAATTATSSQTTVPMPTTSAGGAVAGAVSTSGVPGGASASSTSIPPGASSSSSDGGSGSGAGGLDAGAGGGKADDGEAAGSGEPGSTVEGGSDPPSGSGGDASGIDPIRSPSSAANGDERAASTEFGEGAMDDENDSASSAGAVAAVGVAGALSALAVRRSRSNGSRSSDVRGGGAA